MPRVSQAIEVYQRDYLYTAEVVIDRTQLLAAIEAVSCDGAVPHAEDALP
jgi:hypothetical protein